MDQRIADATAKGQTKLLEGMQNKRTETLKRAEAFAKKNHLEVVLNRMLGQADAEAAAAAAATDAESAGRITQEQALWVAEHAYLRSLSRKPNSTELKVAMNYLTSEDNPTSAVEGLLWSLINTKEFILNH